jgi:peptide/nickel transport system substrate-binding protein
LIATATFGSELAPEVQFLRDFRDNQILRTAAGSAFMLAFNAWYYSFSPSVAGYESTHLVEQTMMRGVLYPLIGILKLSSITFSVASTVPELAALLSGLVASSLIGAFYLGLPLSLVRARVRRLRAFGAQKTLERWLSVMLIGGLSVFLIGELSGLFVLLMISSVAILLSALFLSGTFISGLIARKLQHA